MQSCDLLLYSGKGVAARVIRAVTRSPYSHAALLVAVRGMLFVVEARGAGVIMRPVERALQGQQARIDLYRLPFVTAEMAEMITCRALGLLGTPYGWLDLLRHFWAIVTGRRAISTHDAMICSEMVAAAVGMEYTDLTPGDLADMAEYVVTVQP